MITYLTAESRIYPQGAEGSSLVFFIYSLGEVDLFFHHKIKPLKMLFSFPL